MSQPRERSARKTRPGRRPSTDSRSFPTNGGKTPSSSAPGSDVKLAPSHKALFDAVHANDVTKVKQLVKVNKVSVNIIDEEDRRRPTLLLVACQKQFADVVRILLKAKTKADVNQGDGTGRRPIWWAAMHGNVEIADMLIYDGSADCDVNQVDEESGCTPLYRAILSRGVEVCRLLVHAGADVNLRRLWKITKESEVAESPLVKTVQLDNYKICELLINSLCKINAKTEDGFTALHYAVAYRRYSITGLLLENNIRVNARSRKGLTAMTLAIREHLPAMCKLLVEWGYDMDRPFKWGETPLEMAIRLHSESCAMTMVAWGCHVRGAEKGYLPRGQTRQPSVFQQAAEEGLTRLLKLMVEVRPYLLYEEWILNQRQPLALYKHQDTWAWLSQQSTVPRSLQDLCKCSILKYLGKYGCKNLEKLPLPERMKDFLKVEHHFDSNCYKEVPLNAYECPYYCAPNCERAPQCPELDFSDSASD